MRTVRAVVALVTTGAALLGSGCASMAADCDEEPYASVVEATNRRRAARGIDPLRCDEQLSTAAQRHAADMCAGDFVSHRSADGRMPHERIDAVIDEWTAIGENVGAGQKSAEQVVAEWMTSPKHRANILRPEFTRIGVGYKACGDMDRWVQTFAAP